MDVIEEDLRSDVTLAQSHFAMIFLCFRICLVTVRSCAQAVWISLFGYGISVNWSKIRTTVNWTLFNVLLRPLNMSSSPIVRSARRRLWYTLLDGIYYSASAYSFHRRNPVRSRKVNSICDIASTFLVCVFNVIEERELDQLQWRNHHEWTSPWHEPLLHAHTHCI
jgi:hypothetical protein